MTYSTLLPDGTFKVFVKVDNFQNVTAFNMYVHWDGTKVQYQQVTDTDALSMSPTSDFQLNPSDAPANTLSSVWSNPNSEPSSLASGTTLFALVFKGTCDQSSIVEFINGEFLNIAFVDEFGDNISFTKEPLNLVNPCGDSGNVLKLPDALGESDSKVCLPVKTGSGFTNVTSISTQIQLPITCGTFNEITNINSNVAGLSIANFNLSQIGAGIIVFNWSSANPISISSNSILFEICFTPSNACCNQTVNVSFENVSIVVNGGAPADLAGDGTLAISCPGECNTNQGFTIAGSTVCGLKDDIVTVDFHAYNFTRIVAMYFSLGWDKDCLELQEDGIIIPTPNLLNGFGKGVFSNPNDCGIFLNWVETALTPLSVPDGSVIFSLRFKILKDIGNVCTITIGDACLPSTSPNTLILGENDIELPLFSCEGKVKIGGTISIADVNVTNPKCNSSCDGSIAVNVSGASAADITWTGPNGFTATGSTISNLCAGSYQVKVIACGQETTKDYSLIAPPSIVIDPTSIVPSSNGSNGSIDITVSGGVGNYTFLWSPGNLTTEDINSLAPNTYFVTVTDGNGCTKIANFVVGSNSEPLSVTITPKKFGTYDLSCAESCDGELTANAIGGSSNFSFKWSNNQSSKTITNLCVGSYTVTVTDGAGNTSTASYTLLAPQRINITFDPVYPTDDASTNGSIEAIVSGGLSPYSFTWSTGQSGKLLENIGVGSYSVTVTDQNNCSSFASTELTVGGKGCFEGSPVITPNGDGKNDKLIITCISNLQNRFVLFNRWGERVFENENYSNASNAFEGNSSSGDPLPDDGYYWVLEVKEASGAQRVYKGSVSIIRSLR